MAEITEGIHWLNKKTILLIWNQGMLFVYYRKHPWQNAGLRLFTKIEVETKIENY